MERGGIFYGFNIANVIIIIIVLALILSILSMFFIGVLIYNKNLYGKIQKIRSKE